MKSKVINKIVISTILVIICTCIYSFIFVDVNATLDTDRYTGIYRDPGNMGKVDTIANKIMGVVQAVGSVVAVIMIVYIGLRYMISSPEEKAILKDEKMKLYLIGAVILFAGVNILDFIANNFW